MSEHTSTENHSTHDRCEPVHFFVNDHRYESLDHTLTGLQIKQKAAIPAVDELFLETECGDEVVPNDTTILIRNKDRFHSMPSPQYGSMSDAAAREVAEILAGHRGFVSPQPDGWHHLVLEEFSLPRPYLPRTSNLLVKLPPGYPLAAPDMFWLKPPIQLEAGGAQPQATSLESVSGEQWQRFSWHLSQGHWQPGKTTLRDFLRAVAARLQKAN
jgi:hypothetical protein